MDSSPKSESRDRTTRNIMARNLMAQLSNSNGATVARNALVEIGINLLEPRFNSHWNRNYGGNCRRKNICPVGEGKI